MTISGIPAGTQYLVTEAEANQDGYQTTVTGAEGIIQEGVLSTAVFINDWSKSTTTPEIPDNQDGSRDPNTPQTGDNSLTGLWGSAVRSLLAWAAAHLDGSAKFNRRSESRNNKPGRRRVSSPTPWFKMELYEKNENLPFVMGSCWSVPWDFFVRRDAAERFEPFRLGTGGQ